MAKPRRYPVDEILGLAKKMKQKQVDDKYNQLLDLDRGEEYDRLLELIKKVLRGRSPKDA
jgi:hypothetical protein